MYQLLDYFFLCFHSLLVLFNTFGWLFPRLRKWNLLTLALTAFSWFVMGIWYGWGYCICTDWHWQVREKLGYQDHSRSYIHFLIVKLTGVEVSPGLVDTWTGIVFFVSVLLSITLNVHDYLRRRKKQRQGRKTGSN